MKKCAQQLICLPRARQLPTLKNTWNNVWQQKKGGGLLRGASGRGEWRPTVSMVKKTKDYEEMSCSHDSINQWEAFSSNGKLGPIQSTLSIIEIELPPYWLCTKQTISRMKSKCYSQYGPHCRSFLCQRLLGAHWIIENACMRDCRAWSHEDPCAAGLQRQTSLKGHSYSKLSLS